MASVFEYANTTHLAATAELNPRDSGDTLSDDVTKVNQASLFPK
jgi:hypothetical protein